MPKLLKNFTAIEMANAREMAKYEGKWVAVSSRSGRETVVATGVRITDAKADVDKLGVKDVTYRKVPSSAKILIAASL